MADEGDKYGIFIHDISSSVPLESLARIPFDDQPNAEIVLELDNNKDIMDHTTRVPTYTILVAYTRPGLGKRAQEFVRTHGGRLSLRSFEGCKRAMIDFRPGSKIVPLPRQHVPDEPISVEEAISVEEVISVDGSEDMYEDSEDLYDDSVYVPLNLAVRTFLEVDDSKNEHREPKPWEHAWLTRDGVLPRDAETVGRSSQRIPLPLYRAEKRAIAAAREVEELLEHA